MFKKSEPEKPQTETIALSGSQPSNLSGEEFARVFARMPIPAGLTSLDLSRSSASGEDAGIALDDQEAPEEYKEPK